MSFFTLVSAGRRLADMPLQKWSFQSPLKWNYRALHTSVAFTFSNMLRREKGLDNWKMIQTRNADKKENQHQVLSPLTLNKTFHFFFVHNIFFLLCFHFY